MVDIWIYVIMQWIVQLNSNQLPNVMKGKYNSNNESLFSLDYKIPYSRDSIQSHLEESQEEINFIKVKLTEAYQKLEFQIEANNNLEEQNEELQNRVRQMEEKHAYEKKENSKLKETLEVILKNRKLMNEDAEELKQGFNKKLAQKDKVMDQLRKQIKSLTSKCSSMSSQIQSRQRSLKELGQKFREQSASKQIQNQRQIALANKIHILQQEITRITQQKYIEVSRLRHQLQLYQRSTTPLGREIRIQQGSKEQRRRQFARPTTNKSVHMQKFSTKGTQSSDFQSNKQNQNSLQINHNNSLTESSILKWKRPQSTKDNNNQTLRVQPPTPSTQATEDQQLSLFQIMRKKAEQQLCGLQKIKRPSNEEREKISRLQRQIYHLDSDIAGLKRKIRRKY